MDEEQNYGRLREPGDRTSGPIGGMGREEGRAMGRQDERTWSILA